MKTKKQLTWRTQTTRIKRALRKAGFVHFETQWANEGLVCWGPRQPKPVTMGFQRQLIARTDQRGRVNIQATSFLDTEGNQCYWVTDLVAYLGEIHPSVQRCPTIQMEISSITEPYWGILPKVIRTLQSTKFTPHLHPPTRK